MRKTPILLILMLVSVLVGEASSQQNLWAVQVQPTGNLTRMPGQPVSYVREVISTGFPGVSNYSADLFLSLDTILTPSDHLVHPFSDSTGFSSDGFTLPASVPSGSYHLILDVHPAFSEFNLSDNRVFSSQKLTVISDPDLVASSITPPGGGVAYRGVPFQANFNISDIGYNPPSLFPCEIRLSTDTIINTSDPVLLSFSEGLGAASRTISIPKSFAPGTYYLGLRIPGVGGETNLSNNQVASSSFALQTPIPVVGSVSPASGSFVGGETVSVFGQHLYELVSVEFGAALATNIVSINDGELQCTVPPAPNNTSGLTDVTVTNSGGPGTATDIYTYAPGFPGTGEDIRLSGVLDAYPIPGEGQDIMLPNGGEVLRMLIDSPGGTLDYHFLYFLGNAYLTGNPPMAPAGFPYLYFDPNDPGFFPIIDAGMPNLFFGPPIVVPGGNFLQFVLPTNAAGFSASFQAIVLNPTSANGWFAASNAFEIQLQ